MKTAKKTFTYYLIYLCKLKPSMHHARLSLVAITEPLTEMKKSLRQIIFVYTFALHGITFRWASVSTEYEPFMMVSKLTPEYLTHTQEY